MGDQLDPRRLQEIAKKLGINQPVLSQRVVGSRIELFLLGGSEIVLEAEPGEELESLDYDTLYRMAQQYAIRGRSRMKREALIDALRREMD